MSTNIRIQRVCEYCGNTFTARTTVTRYCGNDCAKKGYKARKRREKIDLSDKETKQAINKPIEALKGKEYLSIAEVVKLVGVSRRTVYRMIDRGILVKGKVGSRTLLRKADLDKIFEKPALPIIFKVIQERKYKISDCYSLAEIRAKYGISSTALDVVIKRNNIPKIKQSIYTYVPKHLIDNILKDKENGNNC